MLGYDEDEIEDVVEFERIDKVEIIEKIEVQKEQVV